MRIPGTAFAVALGAAIVLIIAPLYESGKTLVEANGTGSLALILVPLAVAALPLLVPAQQRFRTAGTSGVVLVLISFVSSAGIFFLPAAIALVVAWWWGRSTTGTA